MAAPLIVAGAKVAGKVIAKKVAAKQAAKIAAKKVAQQAGKKVATEGAKKVAGKKVAGQTTKGMWQKAKNITDKVDRAQEIKDSLTPEEKEDKQKKPSVYKKNIVNKFLGNESTPEDQEKAKEEKPQKFDWKKMFDSASNKSESQSKSQSTGEKATF